MPVPGALLEQVQQGPEVGVELEQAVGPVALTGP